MYLSTITEILYFFKTEKNKFYRKIDFFFYNNIDLKFIFQKKMKEYNKVLNYWFPNSEYNKFWFSADIETDDFIKNNFYDYMKNIICYQNYTFQSSDELLAKIIVLDQFTRNIYRNTSMAYHYDIIALKLAKIYFSNKYDKDHSFNKIIFALMPFRHSEEIKDQKFVLDYLKDINIDKSTQLYKKFERASLSSYQTIQKHNCFPNRVTFQL